MGRDQGEAGLNEAQSAETAQESGTLKGRLEAVLFVAGEPVLGDDLAKALNETRFKVQMALSALKEEYDANQRGFCLRLFGEHVQLTTRPLYAADVVHLLQPVQKQTLSQAIMETLAVVAYRQPVTKAEIEAIRGVKCDYSVQSLTQKGLIMEVGRKDALGKPILYGTTDTFLQRFGIESLEELPPMPEARSESEDDEPAQELMV